MHVLLEWKMSNVCDYAAQSLSLLSLAVGVLSFIAYSVCAILAEIYGSDNAVKICRQVVR